MWVRMHVCMRALSLPLNTEPELTGSNRLLASAEANFFRAYKPPLSQFTLCLSVRKLLKLLF